MCVFLLDLTPCFRTHQRFTLVLARSHRSDVAPLVADHFFRRERAARRSAFHLNQITRLDTILELVVHFGETGVAHRTLQRIAHEFAFVGHRVALQIFLPRVSQRRFDVLLLLLRVLLFHLAGLCLTHYVLRLLAELRGHFPVPLLHFFVRDRRQLFVACLVRGDLCRACASHTLLGEMLLDLLTARTRCLQVFARVARDLRLPALARLDLVTVLLQA